MSDLSSHIQSLRDVLKRGYLGLVKRGGRLRSPMEILILTLQAQGYIPEPVVALELFGMHGLWMTKDYESICSSLELYEVNPVYANYAKKFLRRATVVNSDSIQALKSGQLKRARYNFIVSDNPFISPYGNNYFEHFDLFPELANYLEEGVLVMNFLHSLSSLNVNAQHQLTREKFYGKPNPTLKEAVAVYEQRFSGVANLIDYVFMARNESVGLLALVLERPAQGSATIQPEAKISTTAPLSAVIS